eukprot:TRINITY_DN4355_c0_g2_i2.p1 TRINITY_DN4355_c0_g2~~TRINITY_DN4355_c0_g2_i2.p1  ORF type:complete len:617 (+),score=198.41 TRINITY_DN4355_c0_g2_i2:39-1889(+)
MERRARPVVLNPYLKVESYDGGGDGEDLGIGNALKERGGDPHCSRPGKNFDLVLSSDRKITITNFVIWKPKDCTCLIKSGVLNFYNQLPSQIELQKFNDYNNESSLCKADVYWEIPEDTDYVQIKLEHWKSARYIHIKFIEVENLHGDDSPNVDVDYVGFVGFVDSPPVEFDVGDIDEELGVVPVSLKKFNLMLPDFADELSTRTVFAIFDAEGDTKPGVKETFKEIAEADLFNDTPFLFMWGPDENLPRLLRQRMGFPTGLIATIFNIRDSIFYLHEGDLTKDSLIAFGRSVLAGTAKQFIQSEPRPPKDLSPDHPHLYHLTAHSFDELVVNSEEEFLVDIWADWCGPCVMVGPIIAKLSEVLAGVPGICIGKLNCDYNTVNKKYFPESGIPNIKFFPKGKKDQPIKYNGDRSLTSFIEFIHQNATVKFDLQKYKIVAETSEMMRKVDKLVGEVEGRIPPESRVEMDKLLNAIRAELEKTGVDAEILLKQVAFWEQAPFLAQLNKLKNKNVIHVTSHPEYLALIEKAKVENKLLVVDFFATWCGPCVQLAPLFADWSEEFMDVVFAKVDVDLLRESATFENIQCMPTIKFYKKELLNTIEGFDIEEIRNNIHQNK